MVERIGPYEIERKLAAGGMAEVFLARKPLGASFKRVVVKRMLAEFRGNHLFVQMFLREAEILAQLSHPNIVQIFDLGLTGAGEPYIAMEYLDGISVHDLAARAWRARSALPTELVLRVVLEAARGLEYVHRQKSPGGESLAIVHRDVSPDNLFFLENGIVKLVDFGIARAATAQLLTSKGELKGKLPFVAPEVLDGLEVDHRADLWALGVSAYWLLSGRRPFRGASQVELMRQILRVEPPPLRALCPHAPAWLEELLFLLLTKDRDKRIQSAAAIENIILLNAGDRLDRVADVEFVKGLVTAPVFEGDAVSDAIPAAPRSPPTDAPRTTPSAFLPRTTVPGEERSTLQQHPPAGDPPAPRPVAPGRAPAPPMRHTTPPALRSMTPPHPPAAPRRLADEEKLTTTRVPAPVTMPSNAATSRAASSTERTVLEHDTAVAADHPVAREVRVERKAPPQSPFPRAMRVDVPVDDGAGDIGDTQRLTNSQLGVHDDDE